MNTNPRRPLASIGPRSESACGFSPWLVRFLGADREASTSIVAVIESD